MFTTGTIKAGWCIIQTSLRSFIISQELLSLPLRGAGRAASNLNREDQATTLNGNVKRRVTRSSSRPISDKVTRSNIKFMDLGANHTVFDLLVQVKWSLSSTAINSANAAATNVWWKLSLIRMSRCGFSSHCRSDSKSQIPGRKHGCGRACHGTTGGLRRRSAIERPGRNTGGLSTATWGGR